MTLKMNVGCVAIWLSAALCPAQPSLATSAGKSSVVGNSSVDAGAQRPALATGRLENAPDAIKAAQLILGISLPHTATATAVTTPDDTLFSDRPLSAAEPGWLVKVPGITFTLDWPKDQAPLPDGKMTVDTGPLDYEVLLRASNSAVLRIQTLPFRTKTPAGTVRSLSAKDYRAVDHGRISGSEVQPKSTLLEIYNELLRSGGEPLGAQQVVVHVWSWSMGVSGREIPRNVWSVDVRSDPSIAGSLTDAFDSRVPERSRPKVSAFISIVEDGTNAPYGGGNYPVPMIVDNSGKIVAPGDSGAVAATEAYLKDVNSKKGK